MTHTLILKLVEKSLVFIDVKVPTRPHTTNPTPTPDSQIPVRPPWPYLFMTVPAILLRSSSGVSGAVGTLTTGLQAVAAFKELFYRLKFLADFARVGD